MGFFERLKQTVSSKLTAASPNPDVKAHVIASINQTEVGKKPFYHAWIEDVFPTDFYQELHEYMLSIKQSGRLQARQQDNPEFVNRRFSLVNSREPVVQQFEAIWSDQDVKRAIFSKFYEEKSLPGLVRDATIHKEFEFVFCQPDLFQNIHVDIPPKVLSFVFYLPDGKVTDEEEKKNATILYDNDMKAQYAARFRRNSVCVFAQHHYSYHGFSSTIERDALVMFMVDPVEMRRWKKIASEKEAPFEQFLDAVDHKLHKYKLLEYGERATTLAEEREKTRVNAPKGRVIVD